MKVVDLTLKYNGLHKIALSNWPPTKHVTIVSRDFVTLLFGIGTGAPMHLGQIFFNLIVNHRCGYNKNQKLSFPSLIFGLLESQNPLQEPNKYISAMLQPNVFRFKGKDAGTEGEQDTIVATEKPYVATNDQPGAGPSSSSAVQSFFRQSCEPSKRSTCSMTRNLTRPLPSWNN